MLPNFNPDEPLPAPAVDGAVGGQDTIPGSLQAILYLVYMVMQNTLHTCEPITALPSDISTMIEDVIYIVTEIYIMQNTMFMLLLFSECHTVWLFGCLALS